VSSRTAGRLGSWTAEGNASGPANFCWQAPTRLADPGLPPVLVYPAEACSPASTFAPTASDGRIMSATDAATPVPGLDA
jgi:hypothetical protein